MLNRYRDELKLSGYPVDLMLIGYLVELKLN
jgi:hypothetical protein